MEDDDDIRVSIADCLALQGYVVRLARNGVEALDLLREGRPDVILLDLMMPVMDGRTFLRALRADPALALIPVVVSSATGSLDLGADLPRLDKPFEVEALYCALESAVHPARAALPPPA